MLGRIFENLLAEIDPDSGETARKATGSFYTPREIVNYMVDESLLIYLKSKLQTETVGFQAFGEAQTTLFGNEMRVQQAFEMPISNNRWQGKTDALETELRRLFSYSNNENSFNETETEILIKAIDNCKILDPACGSGAFPIGVLQRLVHLLGKLDADDKKWKEWLKRKAINDTEKAYDKGDLSQRDIRLLQISEAFEKDSSDFGRKLFLIENCIYGVDIQPIAAEISKLRCFLTLIVDDTIDENKANRGVNPLPNLEFKFVTADALLRLPASGLFNSDAQLNELAAVRHEYINSFGASKEAAKLHFKRIQDEIYNAQVKNFRENYDRRAFELSRWNPFGHEKVDWFDSEWMFGVKAFDIVIGNPPYIQMQKDGGYLAKKYAKENYQTFAKTSDIYCLFYEQGNNLLKKGGNLCFITSNSWMRTQYGELLRKYFVEKMNPIRLINVEDTQVFSAATVESNLILLKKENWSKNLQAVSLKDNFNLNLPIQDYFKVNLIQISDLPFSGWIIGNEIESNLKLKIEKDSKRLNEFDYRIDYGIKTGLNEAFFIDTEKKNKLIQEDSNCAEIIKPALRGKDISKYNYKWKDIWVILVKSGWTNANRKNIEPEQFFKQKYPSIYRHFIDVGENFQGKGKGLFKREDQGDYWWELRPCAYYDNFKVEKIVWGELSDQQKFAFDNSGMFANNTIFFLTGKDLKYLLSILNSSLSKWYFNIISTSSGMGTNRWLKYKIEQLPIKESSSEKQKLFENLVDYILFLKETESAEQVNEYVPNSHLVEQFETVIDALVYELYFEDDFRAAEISFLKYAIRDFPSIEKLETPEKIEVIHNSYQKLTNAAGEIQTNLRLMEIRLAELLTPIKTAR